MNKALALFRASLSEGMSFFRISGRNRSKFMKTGVPIIVGTMFMLAMGMYGYGMMDSLAEAGMEYVTLTIFAIITAVVILLEGVYKTSGLLFNCRDDNTVLALPIKKSTVLLIRMMKFYLFEVMVGTLFMAPVMLVYGVRVGAGIGFYLISILALLILPILPVIISCVVGGVISFFSTKFRFKNIAQIVLATVFLVATMFVAINAQGIMQGITEDASGVNETLMRFYYPAGEYIDLVVKFDFWKLMEFVVINVGLLALMVLALGKVYYKINSQAKIIKSSTKKREYKKKNTHRPIVALVKKEISRFATSPVFAVNAGFGLVLYVLVCGFVSINADGILSQVSGAQVEGLPINEIMNYIPAIVFGLIFVTSMMTSITSSMISLEGKSFNILKSLPVSAMVIIMSKILAAMSMMVPVLLMGDLMLFIFFDFDFWQFLMIIASSVVMPMIAETFGIIINLKYPKMNAEDDVEVVKQSMSSMIAVFAGLASSALMAAFVVGMFMCGISATGTIALGLTVGVVVLIVLLLYLKKRGVQEFNAINV